MSPVRRLLALTGLISALLSLSAGSAWAADDCSPQAVAGERAKFQAAWDRKDYAAAEAIIDPLWSRCGGTPPKATPTLAAELASDAALAAHRTDDDVHCLEILETYSPERRKDVPEMARLPKAVRDALRFNYGLCKGYCDDHFIDAACQFFRDDAGWDDVEAEGKRPPCPLKGVPRSAIGLPGRPGFCLAPAASLEKFAFETAGESDPARVCRSLRLVTAQGSKRLGVPKKSWLRDQNLCCAEPVLSIDAKGHIVVEPKDNPMSGCLSGHPAGVVQDIFTLDGERLVLVRGYND